MAERHFMDSSTHAVRWDKDIAAPAATSTSKVRSGNIRCCPGVVHMHVGHALQKELGAQLYGHK